MPTSRDLPPDRLAIGQLLVRLVRQFRAELFEPAAGHGYPDMREPHLHIFGNLGVDGVRLTDLAARAQLSLATASELVSDLQDLGYLERRADGTDKRAKLIFPTPPWPSGARRRRRPGRPDRGTLGADRRAGTLRRHLPHPARTAGRAHRQHRQGRATAAPAPGIPGSPAPARARIAIGVHSPAQFA
jgi:hypothetical protein